MASVAGRRRTNLEVRRGGGGAGEQARQHHVQRDVARATHVALAYLDVLDLRRCNTNTPFSHFHT